MSDSFINLFQFAQIQDLIENSTDYHDSCLSNDSLSMEFKKSSCLSTIDENIEVTSSEKIPSSYETFDNVLDDEDMTATYHDIMTEDYESNDSRIAMIGNVDSGKSTLIGVLTNSTLDDGRGAARSLVMKHRHELENGRTSAVTVEIMGYNGEEQVCSMARNHAQRWAEVVEKSDRTVSLIDLCGHEKYLKTTLFGLTGKMI